MGRGLFGEVLLWSCAAIPAAGALVAVAALVFALLDEGAGGFQAGDLASALGFLLLQTLGPIVVWSVLRRWWPPLRAHFLLEVALFPLAVAAVGWGALAVVGEAAWPACFDVLALSVVGWLGFSWALLAARAVAERLFPSGGTRAGGTRAGGTRAGGTGAGAP